ncbi:MAG: preprotein translocase subunit SecG [Tissierellia bacterium]|nr:preprotein translocase subunit SecG [Tissierellia bacterium]
MKQFVTILLVLSSLVIIAAVLMTEPKTKGMGSISGGDTNIFGYGGKKSKDVLLNRVIVGAFAVFIITAVLVTAI